ncbi:hypothetical protein HMPREF0636_1239 [Porphyromonas catoniae ATCC 51270]|uniref:Uncharacterized protein n=1 Tax=Porphyromonas catoniae ATCC 51270 TaxID=887901 RepID=Z4X1M4_9PORP|nr:hypothetical protein HMPREF0636_1239 [Porphyromonas catoniae ATCC 51270]
MPSKIVKVVATIIFRDGKPFATQRVYGEWKDWWELSGILGYYSLGNNL